MNEAYGGSAGVGDRKRKRKRKLERGGGRD